MKKSFCQEFVSHDDYTTMATLLPLRDDEITMLIFALNAYASAEEQNGDVLKHAALADKVAERARELETLALENVREQMRAIGFGRYRNRPQG